MTSFHDGPSRPRFRLLGVALTLTAVVSLTMLYLQFRGDFASKVRLTVAAPRAGLLMDPGSKVTLDGVPIGRVAEVREFDGGTTPQARLLLDVQPRYAALIPVNVQTSITASTIFGNKYLAFTTPAHPGQPISPTDVLHVTGGAVTTEFNTLFESITSIAEKVDPVQLNSTLTAAADALTGLGDKLGSSIAAANTALGDVNPRIPQVKNDIDQLANLADVYSGSARDLLDALHDALTTARTLNTGRDQLDAALLAATGFGDTGADVVQRAAPYLVRGQSDLIPTARLLDDYSPALLCTVRNFHDVAPEISDALGRNGYSATTTTELLGAANPYVYPDNLPRTNAHGGPGGAPGCWQPISRDSWPAPYLVMDTGASLAPYNHFGLGQPIVNEYVWGRQVGENTINP